MSAFVQLFGGVKPLIGMIHLRPLPGSPRGGDIDDALEAALADAEVLAAAGVDGLIVENFGDAPFAKDRVPPVTVAAMTAVAREIRRAHNVALGINVLRNDAEAALSIATVTDADFIRVNVHIGAVVADQGVIEGKSRETLLLRRALGSSALLFADLRVKHSRPLGGEATEASLLQDARDATGRGGADALILTGGATGAAADASEFLAVKKAVPQAPLIVGSGIDSANLGQFWDVCDGMIVGSSLKVGKDPRSPVDPERAREIVVAASNRRRESERPASRGSSDPK